MLPIEYLEIWQHQGSGSRFMMDELRKRIAALPPEKRALFEQQLQQKNLQLAQSTISKRQDKNELLLSFAQQRLWFLHQLEPDSAAYNIAIAWHFTGHLDIAVLERSLNTIVQRHEILRTGFIAVAGQPSLVILPKLSLPLPIVDLRSLRDCVRQAEVEKLSKQEASRPFNLTQPPLLRVTLLQLAAEKSVLLLTLHHLIADGWSRGVILRELTVLYKAFAAGQPEPLPELPIQYIDFAVWQQQWLQGKELAAQLAYWKQQLKNLSILELPSDRPRKPVQTFRSATQSVLIPKELLQSLKTLSRQQGVTLFMLALAAFKVLLHRYSGQDDIAIGSPIANRNWAETNALVGFFVNTLVLRTDLSGNPSFQELLQRVRDVTAGAYKHQDLPFAKLVEELQPQRSLSHNPLFGVMFQLQNEAYQLQNALTPELAIPGLKLEQMWVDPGSTKFDMTWHLVERSEGLLAVVEYSTDLFDKDTIARMLGHFQVLVKGIIENPEERLSELPILTETERHQILVEWNNTNSEYPSHQGIHQLFEAQVEKTPDNIAVIFQDQQLTYRELNAKANQLAHYLRNQGVKPDVLVGICVERSPLMVIGLLGILKAGGAYVPLDPNYPQERLALMLADAQVSVLIRNLEDVRPHSEFSIPNSELQIPNSKLPITIYLDTDWEIISQLPEDNPHNQTTGQNLAYVIYTSGSTGKPKGAMNTHQGISNRLLWMQDAYQLTPCDRILQKTIFSFDVSVWEFFWPLLVGATLVLAQREGHKDGAYLVKLIAQSQVTTLHFVPSMLQVFLQEPQLENCSSLKRVICSGEALPFELQERFFERLKCELHNLYGPTEAAIDVTNWHCQPENHQRIVPIGRPIGNTQIYILDQKQQLVPIGVPGELYIGGVGLGRGYLNQPELTAEKFIPNPFNNSKFKIQNSQFLYKTGDLARYLPDGNIEFIGRIDYQIKIRGFRIELGEIESVLDTCPQVEQAVVMPREDTLGNQRLVAYIVFSELPIANSELRHFLQQKLPDYMIPSIFVTLPTLPLTPNGKVDRHSLPAPDFTHREVVSNILPRTPNEAILTTIWSEVLGVSAGIYDNFFELGGDSILSIQIIARANQAGLTLRPRQLFQHQTIAELATIAGTKPQIQAEQRIVTGVVPLTPIQHWFFEQNLPQSHHFNQSVLLEVVPLKPDLLEQVWRQLLFHHDALRLRYIQDESGWQQFHTVPSQSVPVAVIDLSELAENEQKVAISAIAWKLQTSLNLSDSLLQCVLFRLGSLNNKSQSDRLLIVVHHLVIDSVSWRILLADFSTAYQQLERSATIQLPPKTTSFQDWANRLIAYAQSKPLLAELDYWLADSRSQFASLPIDYPEGQIHNTNASTAFVDTMLDAVQTRALLEDVPQAYHTQILDVLLTALVQSFAKWSGYYNLLIDLEGHGREDLFPDVDLSRTIGWFTTVFPVRLELKERDPATALKSIKEQLRQVPYRGIGYGLLRYLTTDETVRELCGYASRSRLQHLPPAEVKFNYLGQLDLAITNSLILGLAKESIGELRSPLGRRRYLLEVNSWIAEEKLQMRWSYSQNIHQQTTIAQLAQAFINALSALITHCKSPQAFGYTPSDFAAAKLTQKQLDRFIAKIQKPGKS